MPAETIPHRLAPGDDELAVLSLLASLVDGEWQVVCGSLLSVPREQALTSWRRWAEREPRSRQRHLEPGIDAGPVFTFDPFPGLRAVRAVIAHAAWQATRADIAAGELSVHLNRFSIAPQSWSSTVLLTPDGSSAAHDVVFGARRPVTGVVAHLPEVPIAVSADTWELVLPPHLPRGPDLGSISLHRRELHWPRSLLGIDWLGMLEHAPPRALVVGRAVHRAWIADVRSNAESGEIEMAIGWREDRVDPLGLSIYARSHKDGLTLLARQLRVSDLPPRGDLPELDPRMRPWRERVLSIGLPRGPRRTDWGVQLFDANGQLLDERPVVPRVERIEMAMHIDGSAEPASTMVIGDRQPVPSPTEHDDAVDQALAVEEQARHAAAARRMSTTGELKDYLHWRLSCRDGELLLLDPYLLQAKTAPTTLAFLAALDRPIRALTAKWDAAAAKRAQAMGMAVRRLPQGVRDLHDRVWLFGESGLLVGGSVNLFVPFGGEAEHPATTATELPPGDAAAWRERFEAWWP